MLHIFFSNSHISMETKFYPYLTHSIDANILFVVRAGGAVFDFAGHGEEEVKVFCNAVQLTDVFICTWNKQIYTTTLVSIKK